MPSGDNNLSKVSPTSIPIKLRSRFLSRTVVLKAEDEDGKKREIRNKVNIM